LDSSSPVLRSNADRNLQTCRIYWSMLWDVSESVFTPLPRKKLLTFSPTALPSLLSKSR
jgi:hypothetical protein